MIYLVYITYITCIIYIVYIIYIISMYIKYIRWQHQEPSLQIVFHSEESPHCSMTNRHTNPGPRIQPEGVPYCECMHREGLRRSEALAELHKLCDRLEKKNPDHTVTKSYKSDVLSVFYGPARDPKPRTPSTSIGTASSRNHSSRSFALRAKGLSTECQVKMMVDNGTTLICPTWCDALGKRTRGPNQRTQWHDIDLPYLV